MQQTGTVPTVYFHLLQRPFCDQTTDDGPGRRHLDPVVVAEIVFSRPGLGKLILMALSQRDYTLLQGLIVIYTLMVVLVNLLTDLTYGFLDPRVQYK